MNISYKDILLKLEKERQETELKSKEQIKNILERLKQNNVDTVIIEFDGSGDSGSINYISTDPPDMLNYTDDVIVTGKHQIQ